MKERGLPTGPMSVFFDNMCLGKEHSYYNDRSYSL